MTLNFDASEGFTDEQVKQAVKDANIKEHEDFKLFQAFAKYIYKIPTEDVTVAALQKCRISCAGLESGSVKMICPHNGVQCTGPLSIDLPDNRWCGNPKGSLKNVSEYILGCVRDHANDERNGPLEPVLKNKLDGEWKTLDEVTDMLVMPEYILDHLTQRKLDCTIISKFDIRVTYGGQAVVPKCTHKTIPCTFSTKTQTAGEFLLNVFEKVLCTKCTVTDEKHKSLVDQIKKRLQSK